jgi:hypothetical protein
MLLLALLVMAPPGPVQGKVSERTDVSRLEALLRHGTAFFGLPTIFVLDDAAEQSLAAGDFNADGHIDLVVAEQPNDRVWLLAGDGLGHFALPARMPVHSRQKVVARGDFDGDGLADQAVADQFSSGVTLRFGDGAGSTERAVLVWDFDEDGAADLAIVDGVANHVTVVLADEHGAARSTTNLPVGVAPGALAVGDFNDDGSADLVVANGRSDTVSVLLGDGYGGFGAATHFAVGAGPTGVVVNDINGDGLADLAVANDISDDITLLPGDGTGGFGAAITLTLPGHGEKGPERASQRRNTDVSASVASDTYEGIVSLALSPTTITGGSGAASTGTVTLNAPAPAGGVVVTLSSSNFELASMVPSITVPEGATSATFTVATNALYRRYSGLAFSATVSAAHNAVTRTATLNVTAQARPTAPAFNPDRDLSGPNCAGEAGILFNCKSDLANPFSCTFRQECTIACMTRPPQGLNWRDTCATSGPFPIALNPKRVVGGNASVGTLLLSAAAPAGSVGRVTSDSLVAQPENRLDMPIPQGATSLTFDVLTAPVNAIQFAPMDAHITTSDTGRHQRTWLAVVSGTPPPVNLISLALDLSSLRGGLSTAGNACIDQLKPAPEVGDVPLVITSSDPAVATITSQSFPQGSNCSVFGVQTAAVAANTPVTITATLGAQTLTTQLTVTATPPADRVNSFFVDPGQVVGGNPSTGLVVLNGLAPAGGALVVFTEFPAGVVILPASVTVPAGTDRVSFTIGTNAVAADTNVSLTANWNSSGAAFTSLTVLSAGPALTVSSHTLSPTSVTSGGTSTGTVTLSGPAGSAGAVVALSSSHSGIASVPASVTVPAGASSATYTATAGTVTATSSATLTASLGGTSRAATLTVTPVPAPASLSAVAVNPTSVTGGSNSTGTVTLTSAAPSGGLVVSLSSSHAAASVPASVTVASGATTANFTVTTTTVASATSVTITATQGTTTRTATLTVNPQPTGPLPAPSLIAPANDARFSPGQNITFDWSDVAGAASYTLQIDNNQTIASPFVLEQTVTASVFSTSTLPVQTMWFRVRANDASGNPGSWSSVRRFEVKD